MKVILVLTLLLVVGLINHLPAANLAFTLHDIVGDPRDRTDVIEVYFQFDNLTGNFGVKVTTDRRIRSTEAICCT